MVEMQNEIMKQIKSGKVAKKPVWFFRAEYYLEYLCLAILGLGLVFLTSATLYFIGKEDIYEDLSLENIWQNTPWETIVLLGMLTVLCFLIYGQISLHYRYGWEKIFAGLFLLVVVGSSIVYFCNIHDNLRKQAFLDEYYENEGMFSQRRANFVKGKVVDVNDREVRVQDSWGKVWLVGFKDDANIPDGKIILGKNVRVIGEQDNNVFQAKCIKLYSLARINFDTCN